jgi:hypothetical protein
MKKIFKDEKLKRAMIAFDCKFVKDFANLFDVTSQNLNGYIDRNTFIDLIKAEVYKRGLDLHWIETGEGTPSKIAEPDSIYSPGTATETAPTRDVTDLQNHELGELIKQTTEVLLSRTKYGYALKENIEAFHQAVNEAKKPNDPSEAARNGSDPPPPKKKAVG